jgi:hypothetical protein
MQNDELPRVVWVHAPRSLYVVRDGAVWDELTDVQRLEIKARVDLVIFVTTLDPAPHTSQ